MWMDGGWIAVEARMHDIHQRCCWTNTVAALSVVGAVAVAADAAL